MKKGRSKDFVVSFGKRLRALRLAKELTPSQFQGATGIDAHELDEYEEGRLEPGLEAIMVMAKALGISHLDLLDIDDPQKR